MATTSLSLGPYWEKFIKDRVASGRFASATEVIRDALRRVDEHEKQLERLRAALAPGIAQADCGEFVEDPSVERVMTLADKMRHEHKN